MLTDSQRTAVQMVSLVKPTGELEVSLVDVQIPKPGPDEVVVRVDATPINPSDLILLLPGVDPSSLKTTGTAERPVLTGRVMATGWLTTRLGQALAVGNEGAGTVVEAGSSPTAQALVGKLVAIAPGSGMYAQYRVTRADQCLVLAAGTAAVDAASAVINPLTALGFVETMRREGHSALVNTAAASNLGQMLVRICLADNISLVNIVRSAEQRAQLVAIGAKYVVDSTSPTFTAELAAAIAETGATLAFDAIGGGPLASQILRAMEAALVPKLTAYSRYGSPVHKQVYIYGGLDMRPTELERSYGLAWGVGGWLLTPLLFKVGAATVGAMRARVAAELTTTFASPHAKQVSLAEALQLDAVHAYSKRSTGAKYLIVPQRS